MTNEEFFQKYKKEIESMIAREIAINPEFDKKIYSNEDISQTLWLHIFDKIENIEEARNPMGMCRTLIKNKMIDLIRFKNMQKRKAEVISFQDCDEYIQEVVS